MPASGSLPAGICFHHTLKATASLLYAGDHACLLHQYKELIRCHEHYVEGLAARFTYILLKNACLVEVCKRACTRYLQLQQLLVEMINGRWLL